MIVKTKGSVKSLMKLLPGEIISRTSVVTFLFEIVNSEYENPDGFDCTNFFLLKYLYGESHVKRTWKPNTIFKNNNSAATTVVRSGKAKTRE